MTLAARPGTPIRRLVLNDFGARVPAVALQRIGSYLRGTRPFRTAAEVEEYLPEIYETFGALSDAQWRHLAEHSVVEENGQLRMNYDPKIVTPFSRPLFLDVALWRMWEQVACSVLIVRGQNSDLLLPETVVEMKRRGTAAKQGRVRSVEIPAWRHAPALMSDEQIRLIEDFLLTETVGAEARQLAASGTRVQ